MFYSCLYCPVRKLAYRRWSIKCWVHNPVHFIEFPHLLLLCYYRIWLQLKPSLNCLCYISQSEACKEYFKRLSCGLFLKCHVTPKVILCYFDYLKKIGMEVGWKESNSNWNSTPPQASGVETLLIFRILEIRKEGSMNFWKLLLLVAKIKDKIIIVVGLEVIYWTKHLLDILILIPIVLCVICFVLDCLF